MRLWLALIKVILISLSLHFPNTTIAALFLTWGEGGGSWRPAAASSVQHTMQHSHCWLGKMSGEFHMELQSRAVVGIMPSQTTRRVSSPSSPSLGHLLLSATSLHFLSTFSPSIWPRSFTLMLFCFMLLWAHFLLLSLVLLLQYSSHSHRALQHFSPPSSQTNSF